MLGAIKKFFSGLNPFQATKKENPELSDSKMLRASQVLSKSVSAPAEAAPPKQFTAEPIKSEGWVSTITGAFRRFSSITGIFRNAVYSLLKGDLPRKPAEIRQLFAEIGGVENKLKTDHMTVRTMHLKASGVLEKIKEAHGSRVELQTNGKTLSGFVFDKAPVDLKNTLSKLCFLDSLHTDSKGEVSQMSGPWTMEVINGKTYILTKSDYQYLLQNDKITEEGFSKDVSLVNSLIISPQGNNTTVVLGGGICSYYESSRSAQEAAAFLVRGIDVVIFEDKNIQESEAKHHVMAARAAIFDHLISLGLRIDQIILKGLCFSSVPAIQLSALMEGKVSVICDQGFMDITEVARNGVGIRVWKPFSNIAKALAEPIINRFSEMDLDYKMDRLHEITAPLCVIVNENDELILKEERNKMDEALKGKTYHRVTINNPNIRHAGPWYQDNDASKQLDNFLKEHFNNQSIIGVS